MHKNNKNRFNFYIAIGYQISEYPLPIVWCNVFKVEQYTSGRRLSNFLSQATLSTVIVSSFIDQVCCGINQNFIVENIRSMYFKCCSGVIK